RSCNIAWDKCKDWQKVSNTSAVAFGQVRMANLSIIGSHSVNGVSELHSSLIKKTVFKDFYDLDPQIFTNVTNGIAHRRWLCQSNPKLSNFIVSLLGDGFIKDADQLKKLNAYAEDTAVLDELGQIKRSNKESFATYLYKKDGIIIDPNTRFDVQVKRLHEYKRQLLNVLKIVSLYHDLKENPDLDVTPQTFIFGAKAAPSYYFAKQIIKLICFISEDLKRNPKIREKLNVVFLENYCVTLAEKLIPSAEISEQISLAGKEASGTGNMKFMINGAITFGTLDGANVEIHDSVGDDNIFIFGHDAKRVADIWAKGYSSTEYYFKNPKLRIIVEELNNGFAGESFTNISNYLLRSNQVADPYMCFADFADYMKTYDRIDKTYADTRRWNKMSLVNIAESGRFSADRAIKEYATRIWNLDRND
ncbi:MAG: glycogen/starch/alpha-glucan phosphorylase, partial [Clostridia bacterium]